MPKLLENPKAQRAIAAINDDKEQLNWSSFKQQDPDLNNEYKAAAAAEPLSARPDSVDFDSMQGNIEDTKRKEFADAMAKHEAFHQPEATPTEQHLGEVASVQTLLPPQEQ